jgi:DNA-binding winged helix-turn-helix (wHTH) protein
LRPKSFEVLRYLVERSGQLVPHQEILDRIWNNAVVTEDSVRQCINEVRKALGDTDQTVVRNIPRRGYRFDLPVHAVNDDALTTTARWVSPRLAAAAAVAFALLAAVTIWWLAREGGGYTGTSTDAPANSIAVLRFTDMSPGRNQGHLSDGLAEEILNRLSQSRSLRVTARTSSFAVHGETIDVIASQLNVAYVLEGSVRRSGLQPPGRVLSDFH